MIEDTENVAKLLAKYNCTMVQGGAKIGLMGVVVQEFQKYSDEVVMIVPEVHKSDLVGAKCKEHYIVEGESDRMRITIHTCDMMVVLPGGSGTLAELAYYTETCKSGEHKAKVVVVNTNGYYNKLFKFHKHQVKNGFMQQGDCKFEVINSAKELEPIIQELITKKQAEIQKKEAEAIKKAQKEKKLEAKKAPKKSTSAKKVEKVKKAEEVKTAPKAKVESKKVVKAPAKKAEPTPKKAKPKTAVKPAVKPVAKTTKTTATKAKKAQANKKTPEVVAPKNPATKKTTAKKTTATKKIVAKKTELKKAVEKKTEPKNAVAKKASTKKSK